MAVSGELPKPDFKCAVKIYRNDIRKSASKVGEFNQELSTAYKEIKKVCNIHPGAAKLAFKLERMEDTKRDDFLRSLQGLMLEMNIGITEDLVDAAEGNDQSPIIPTVAKAETELATLN